MFRILRLDILYQLCDISIVMCDDGGVMRGVYIYSMGVSYNN